MEFVVDQRAEKGGFIARVGDDRTVGALPEGPAGGVRQAAVAGD